MTFSSAALRDENLFTSRLLGMQDQSPTNQRCHSAHFCIAYPRRREDCRTRGSKENEKLPSAEYAGCWAHHGGTKYRKAYAVLTPVLGEAQLARAQNQSLAVGDLDGIFERLRAT